MRVRVRLFAMLREQAGWRDSELDLADEATIGEAWSRLASAHPAMAPMREYVRFARNGRYAAADERLADGDELAIIPPVAGGAGTGPRLELRSEPIDDALLGQLRRELPTPADGALVLFVGQTRESGSRPGEPVESLDYEAHESMALEIFRHIAAEMGDRFGVTSLAIIHRTGHVGLGEPSVVIGVAAAHREAAFDAARYAIEELKARAPIWKSEQYASGSVWVGQPARESSK
jgi:molybdopterin converting factor subunit 1